MADLAEQYIAKAEASVAEARTFVWQARLEVSKARKNLKRWLDLHPDCTGDEPAYKTRKKQVEDAIAWLQEDFAWLKDMIAWLKDRIARLEEERAYYRKLGV
ncbi:hypothetical protein HDU80_002992 [Chytriomyces hyalinus]|nr:hypothetical protein HDU80_002992 [Chytriomyces hyalinus]